MKISFKKTSSKILFIFSLVFLFNIAFTNLSFAATTSGFLSDNIWYSPTSFGEGDTVQIHTAIWNDDVKTLSVTLSFLDGTTLLATRTFDVPSQTLKDISIPWKVSAGDHNISAKITSSKEDNKDVVLTQGEVKDPKIFIPKKIVDAKGNLTDPVSSITEKVTENFPESIKTPVDSGIKSLDLFRVNTEDTLNNIYKDTDAHITQLSLDLLAKQKSDFKNIEDKVVAREKVKEDNAKSGIIADTTLKVPDSSSSIEKPILYVELFFVGIAKFVFGNAMVFYGLILVLTFFILRFVFRLIRRRRY